MMAVHENTSHSGNLSKIWCASTMLPHWTYILMSAFATWTSVSNPSAIIWQWMCLPCSSSAGLTHIVRMLIMWPSQLQIICMHLVKEFKCLFSISLLNISWNHHSPWYQILCQHSVKHPVTICQTTILCIHSDKCSHHVDVWLKFSFYDVWVHLSALFQNCSWTSNCMEDATTSNPLVAWAQISRRPVHRTPAEHIQRSWWSMKPHPVWACCKTLGSHQEYSCTWHTCWEGCSIEKQLA